MPYKVMDSKTLLNLTYESAWDLEVLHAIAYESIILAKRENRELTSNGKTA